MKNEEKTMNKNQNPEQSSELSSNALLGNNKRNEQYIRLDSTYTFNRGNGDLWIRHDSYGGHERLRSWSRWIWTNVWSDWVRPVVPDGSQITPNILVYK